MTENKKNPQKTNIEVLYTTSVYKDWKTMHVPECISPFSDNFTVSAPDEIPSLIVHSAS